VNDLDNVFTGAQRATEPTGSRFLSFELKGELHDLRWVDHPWQAGRNAKTLVKYPDFRILLVGLRQGAHLAEHHAAGSISIQTIAGHVMIRAAGRVFDLPEGELLALKRGVPHDVESLGESAILVTIAWPGAERS
jgi:quercetin dioxygenase-like cupin family protein